jgi:dolichol-phosphate mannosyltransferase
MTDLLALLPPPTGALQVPSSPPSLQLSLVIPTYNEGDNIAAMIQQISGLLDRVLPAAYEIIVVDDDSPDLTWKIAQSMGSQFPQLRVMRRQQERGLSTAVVRGWQMARGEILGVIDGDLQHPPEILLKLLAAISSQNADLAVASRHVEEGGVSDWSFTRRILSRGAQVLGLVILPRVVGRASDPMSGYFLVRRSAIAGVRLSPLGYKILLEVIGRGRIQSIAEVGYVFQERQGGESKVTWRQYIDYLRHLCSLRWRSSRVVAPVRHLPIRRFIQFGLVGLSGVFVDMAVFYLLSDPAALGWGLTRSKMLAAEVAICNNFLWNDRWTFGDVASRQQGWRKRIRRFIKFNLVCLAGLILNVLILNLFFNQFGINRYVANLMAIALVTIWNFWLNLKLSWRVTDTQP